MTRRWSEIRTVEALDVVYRELANRLVALVNDEYFGKNAFGTVLPWVPDSSPSIGQRPTEGDLVERSGDAFEIFYTERGGINTILSNASAEDVLYYLIRGACSSLAQTYECRHRISGQDSRRQWFELEAKLLSQVNPDWVSRLRSEQNQTLRQYPFKDVPDFESVSDEDARKNAGLVAGMYAPIAEVPYTEAENKLWDTILQNYLLQGHPENIAQKSVETSKAALLKVPVDQRANVIQTFYAASVKR